MRLKWPLIDRNRQVRKDGRWGQGGGEVVGRPLSLSLIFSTLSPIPSPAPKPFLTASFTCSIPSSPFPLIAFLYSFVYSVSLISTSSFVFYPRIQYILKFFFLPEELSMSPSYNFIICFVIQRHFLPLLSLVAAYTPRKCCLHSVRGQLHQWGMEGGIPYSYSLTQQSISPRLGTNKL